MQEPTKADLAAAVATLTEENAGLRDMLAAVSECARSVPLAVYDQQHEELRRAKDVLTELSGVTDPCGTWAWSWGSGQGAAYLREHAAEPVGYQVYGVSAKAESDEAAAVSA